MQDVTRLDVVNYISHGLSKIAEEKTATRKSAQARRPSASGEGGSALEKYTTQPQRAWRRKAASIR